MESDAAGIPGRSLLGAGAAAFTRACARPPPRGSRPSTLLARLDLKVRRRVTHRRSAASIPRQACRSSTSVRVPVRAVRRGRCGVGRWQAPSSGGHRLKVPAARSDSRRLERERIMHSPHPIPAQPVVL
jgi:hypothetical protein